MTTHSPSRVRSWHQMLRLSTASLVAVLSVTALHAQTAIRSKTASLWGAKVTLALPSKQKLATVLPQHTVTGLEKRIAEIKAATNKRNAANQTNLKAKTGYYEAYLYHLRQRAYPNDSINLKAYAAARRHRDQMKPARWGRGLGTAAIGASWEFIGAKNLPVPYRTYYGLGPLSGRINAIAYHPTQPNTFFLAAATGGVWKTTNGGTNWTPLSDDWSVLPVSSLAVHPLQPNAILAGTGDFNGSRDYGIGLMKSNDGGATWKNLGSSVFSGLAISAIAWDPENPNIITVAPGRGATYYSDLYRSTDGGTTWNSVLNVQAPWSSLAYSARTGSGVRRLYATGHFNGGKVYRSDDRGATWTQLAPPISPGVNFYDQNSLRVATSPTAPNVVYLLDGFDRKIFKSTNAGNTWSDITAGFPSGNASLGADYNWTQNSYDFHIACSTRMVSGVPTDVIYVGLIDLAQSPDGGATWQSIGGPTYTEDAILHNDQHSMAINPANPNDALVGCDGGIYRLTYDPTANTWSYASLNAEIGINQYYKMAAHPTDLTRLIGGAQDNASPVAVGDLNAWQNVGGGDGGFSAILDSNVQYTTSQNLSISKTMDGWVGSGDISPDTGSDLKAFIAPITLAADGSVLYGASNHLYARDEAAGTWTDRVGGQLLSSTGYVQYVAIAPSDPSRIYTGSVDGEVWMTEDAGTTWTQINTGTTSLPNRAVTYIVVSAADPSDILVGLSGTGEPHLWQCSDTTAGGARTWVNRSGAGASGLPDIPLNAIALDIDTPATTWFVGTDVGLFMTTNSGATWTNATQPLGLPNVQVNDLKAVPGTRSLYAATFGRGIWRIPFPTVDVRSVTGTITLEGVSVAAGQKVTFELRPALGSSFQRTIPLEAGGAFSLINVPAANYTVWIKGAKHLAKVVSADVTSSDISGLSASLLVGDVNDNNSVDITDLLLLIASYNQVAPAAGYSGAADLNGDGTNDITDLLLLIANYNKVGSP
jgi:photosystem II stability/assembly factor-like uncharacterized protein